jgi:hypothetical protein
MIETRKILPNGQNHSWRDAFYHAVNHYIIYKSLLTYIRCTKRDMIENAHRDRLMLKICAVSFCDLINGDAAGVDETIIQQNDWFVMQLVQSICSTG